MNAPSPIETRPRTAFESAWQTLFEDASIGGVLLDNHLCIVCSTTPVASILNRSNEELFKKKLWDVLAVVNESTSPGEPELNKVDGMALRVTTRSTGRALRLVLHEVADASPLRGYFIGCLWDETGLNSLEQKLAHHDRLAGLGGLIAAVAHEIAGPLNLIGINAEILLVETQVDERGRQVLSMIRDEANRLGDMLHNLLGFTRDTKLNIQGYDPETVVERTVELLRVQRNSTGVGIRVDAEPALPKVAGDAKCLQQVFFNLIKNGCEASSEGDEVLVAIQRGETSAGAEAIQFTVLDHGEGIPASNLERIFEPFFTTKSRELGTGLGLSIARRIVAAHSGELRLESAAGQETRAVVLLPTWSTNSATTAAKTPWRQGSHPNAARIV